MDVPLCHHVKPDGVGCGTPAIRNHEYCYHHSTVRKLVPKATIHGLHMPGPTGEPYADFEMPYLENETAIQIGFMQLIHGVGTGLVEPIRARMMLSALHGAAANLREMNKTAAHVKVLQAMIQSLGAKKKPESVKRVEAEAEESA